MKFIHVKSRFKISLANNADTTFKQEDILVFTADGMNNIYVGVYREQN